MSQITIFKDADVQIDVVQGVPPVDQSAQVADLTAQVASLTAERDALKAKIAKAVADLG